MMGVKLRSLINSLDNPVSNFDKFVVWLFLILTYLTVTSLVAEEVFPDFYYKNNEYFNGVEYLTLFVFSVEFIVRLFFSENKIKYITSFYGIIDLLSVLPSLFGILGTGSINGLWLRIFKVFRLVRLLKFVKLGNTVGGFIGKLIPFFAATIAFKGLVVVLESRYWWPDFQNIGVVVGVVGFALAILLGTKLRAVHSRISTIEAAVCRIVGALRDMQNQSNIRDDFLEWSRQLEKALKSPKEMMDDMAMNMRKKTDALEERLEKLEVGSGTTAGFHKDVVYLLHQATSETPSAYDKFLRYVIISYTIVVILAVPGMVGFISSVLMVYILGGMYFLIDDMDNPLDYGEGSFIDVRLDALEFYNRSGSGVINQISSIETGCRGTVSGYGLEQPEVI
ncbi:MAG: hypothetical protein CSB47_01520 [Proteobacteria bacterium]|nr:MAG: hypothetical protein CSB47_01520 [Pseudomonadota bacterium]